MTSVVIETAMTRPLLCLWINTEFVLLLMSRSDGNGLEPKWIMDSCFWPRPSLTSYESSVLNISTVLTPVAANFSTLQSLVLIDKPVRHCRGSVGGEFYSLIHISWTACISSSTSVFQPSAWFMEEIWTETKTLTNTNAEWLIFKWQIPSHWLYRRSPIEYILSCCIPPCPISLFHECTVELTLVWFRVYQYFLY